MFINWKRREDLLPSFSLPPLCALITLSHEFVCPGRIGKFPLFFFYGTNEEHPPLLIPSAGSRWNGSAEAFWQSVCSLPKCETFFSFPFPPSTRVSLTLEPSSALLCVCMVGEEPVVASTAAGVPRSIPPAPLLFRSCALYIKLNTRQRAA